MKYFADTISLKYIFKGGEKLKDELMRRQMIRVNYYDDIKRHLIKDAIIPVVFQLKKHGIGEQVYLTRNWKQGPHVRIIFRRNEKYSLQNVESLIQKYIYPFLNNYPSTKELDSDKFLKLSERLAKTEIEPPPYSPLLPDNYIQIEEFTEDPSRIGGEHLVHLKEKLLSEATLVIHQTIQDERLEIKEWNIFVTIMLLTLVANSYPDGLQRGYMSLRSNLEQFMFRWDRKGEMRSVFKKKFIGHRDLILKQINNILAGNSEVGDIMDFKVLESWKNYVNGAWATAKPYSEKGLLIGDPLNQLKKWAEKAGLGEEAIIPGAGEVSEFHKILRKLNYKKEWVDALDFPIYRFILNCFYQIINLFDISPIERNYAMYCISESCEIIYGKTWKDTIESQINEIQFGENEI